jgi:DDE superfamily endonuclease
LERSRRPRGTNRSITSWTRQKKRATYRSSQRPNGADHASAKPQVTTPDEIFGTQTLVEAFLDEHSHVFLHNTPTHASWLNQVELFFSIIERRLLRNGEFNSTDELATRIIEFIKAYNRTATPFRWTYDGRPLKIA